MSNTNRPKLRLWLLGQTQVIQQAGSRADQMTKVRFDPHADYESITGTFDERNVEVADYLTVGPVGGDHVF